jgi:hypothetical protein
MIEVVRGRLSKQIAGDIGISETTVKVHRSNLMRKMQIRSLTELTRIADKLKLGQQQRTSLGYFPSSKFFPVRREIFPATRLKIPCSCQRQI